MPHEDGVTDPARIAAAADDAAAVIFPQPNFFGCLEDAPALAAAAPRGRARSRSRTSTSPRSACSRRPAPTAATWRSARGRRRQLPELRRPALRLPRRAHGVHPPAAGPDRRRDDRPRRRARLRADAADARAAHPPREGDVEHDDQPDAARARRARHLAWLGPQGLRELGETCMALAALRAGAASALPARVRPADFKEFAVRTPKPAREVIARRAEARRPSGLRARPRLRGPGRRRCSSR